jgi:hypothetical protein
MTFHQDFTRALSADVASTLGLPVEAVYMGRQAQKVTRQGLEVWVQPGGTEPVGRGLTFHTYDLHVRLKTKRQADGTGAEQLEVVRDAIDLLRERYDGRRPFVQAVPALVATQADEQTPDEDEDDQDMLTAVLRVRALEAPHG